MTAAELIRELEALGEEFASSTASLDTEQAIRDNQAQFLGKKGRVSQLMKRMAKLAPEDRRDVGAVANRVKASIEGEVTSRLGALDDLARRRDLERRVDVTLPGRTVEVGHAHVLSQVWADVVGIFAELGFDVVEGPEVETDFHNFEALAMPKNHPARDEQDTFYITDDVVLRTHTSPVQIRTMLSHPPPIKIVAPGRVYRRDDDPTHSPMFMQVEGLLVDEGVRFSDLKGVLLHLLRRFFGTDDMELRFRPSYFPFVEPGAEVDMRGAIRGGQWLELGGCGMVDPDVFAHVGIDSERYTGFAFGFGLDRMAMLRHGIDDIKHLYSGDLRFLRQF